MEKKVKDLLKDLISAKNKNDYKTMGKISAKIQKLQDKKRME